MSQEEAEVEMAGEFRIENDGSTRTTPEGEQNEQPASGDLESANPPNNPRVAPNRRVRRVIRDILREHYLCFVLVWLIFVLALAIATFVTFIEMLIVFRKHHHDKCDMPLEVFVWMNIVTFAYHNTLHLCIQRWLGYDPALYNTDEPVPEAVARYEAFVQMWSFMLCIAGVVLVSEAETCPRTAPELYRSVSRFVWTGFVLAIACIFTSLSTAIFVMLMRQGALSTSDAAPVGTLEQCRVVATDSELKEDQDLLKADDDGEAKACPICMEPFDSGKEIRQTPCKHLFHGQCLSGWLNVSRCCPMCRHDFTLPVSSSGQGGSAPLPPTNRLSNSNAAAPAASTSPLTLTSSPRETPSSLVTPVRVRSVGGASPAAHSTLDGDPVAAGGSESEIEFASAGGGGVLGGCSGGDGSMREGRAGSTGGANSGTSTPDEDGGDPSVRSLLGGQNR